MAEKKLKTLTGEIVADGCDKTVTVLVSRIKSHPLYKKNYTVSKKIKAHDEKNEYKVGDWVKIAPNKPVSKEKKYIVLNKVK